MEGELMRIAMEPLLFKYGVDIIVAGHVHSYERTKGIYNNTVDECGPVYLNVGDGGNCE
jgi:UDP-2,3-diacylglucosamine pyrophosphatase LpxH